MSTAFSSKTSVLNADGNYTFRGEIFAGMLDKKWDVHAPTSITPVTDIARSAQGIATGITSLVIGVGLRALVGIGAFGFNTGVYAQINFAATIVKQSDIVLTHCRSGTINATLESGVGYSLPSAIMKLVNIFVRALTGSEISTSGTLLKGPSYPLFHGRQMFQEVVLGCNPGGT